MSAYERGLQAAAEVMWDDYQFTTHEKRCMKYALLAFLDEQPTHPWCTLHNLPSGVPEGGCAQGTWYSPDVGDWRYDCTVVSARIVVPDQTGEEGK